LRSFLSLAGDRPVIVGGLKVAAVVGTVLNAINQGDRLFALRLDEVVWWKIGLTYLVPFCVSVFSAARIRMVLAQPHQSHSRSEPMTSAERRLLERAYRVFNARDIDAALAMMHPDVAWPNGFEGGTVHGHAEVRDYWTRQWKQIDPRVDPVSFTEEDDGRIAVGVHQVVRDLAGSLLSDQTVQHVYRIEDGLVRSMEIRKP
jgi:ketosteroid isomerase-like protein